MRYVIKNPSTGYYQGNCRWKPNIAAARLWHRRKMAEQYIIDHSGDVHGWVVIPVKVIEAE